MWGLFRFDQLRMEDVGIFSCFAQLRVEDMGIVPCFAQLRAEDMDIISFCAQFYSGRQGFFTALPS